MLRCVGYLVAVKFVFGVGKILCFLVSIVAVQPHFYFPELPDRLHGYIATSYFHTAQIEHGPAELTSGRVSDDFIGNDIIVSVGLYFQRSEKFLFPVFPINNPSVVLDGIFRVV